MFRGAFWFPVVVCTQPAIHTRAASFTAASLGAKFKHPHALLFHICYTCTACIFAILHPQADWPIIFMVGFISVVHNYTTEKYLRKLFLTQWRHQASQCQNCQALVRQFCFDKLQAHVTNMSTPSWKGINVLRQALTWHQFHVQAAIVSHHLLSPQHGTEHPELAREEVVCLPQFLAALEPCFVQHSSLKKVSVKFEIGADLPKVANLKANKVAFCLKTLFENSAKFSLAGTITVRAKMVAPRQLRLEVIDEGRGLSAMRQRKQHRLCCQTTACPVLPSQTAAQKSDLFRKFSSSGKPNQRGLGLGLWTVDTVCNGSAGLKWMKRTKQRLSLASWWIKIPIKPVPDDIQVLDDFEVAN
jgi:hypothetical protein